MESNVAVEAAWDMRGAARVLAGRLGLALLAALVAAGCDDDGGGDVFGGSPDAPQNLISFTGDQDVVLAWDAPGGEVESYNVYALIEETGDFEVIGITTSTAFLDDDVVNGETYFYRVTAVDFDGDESDFSNETFDTPRPDELNVLLFSLQANPVEAAFDLTQGRVVSSSSSEATFRFDETGGLPRIVPVNGAEMQDVGFVDRLACRGAPDCTELNFAPEAGYLPEGVQAFVGDAYVFRIPRGGDRFFGAVRVSHIASGVLIFDWAFQTDEGNRELLRRPASEPAPSSD